jgi:methionyl-tRNA formyltransferase
MKWILCGKNDAAVECLEFLVGRGDEVWALGNAGDDGTDGWQRSLRSAAGRLGGRFDQPPRINDPDVVDRLRAFGAHALVSIQYEQILRRNLFQSIGCPCLNLHFALLPRHRGMAPIAWAVLAGDSEAGVTLHHMVEDIDAGDVIARRAVAIEPEDTARDVYEKVSRATVALFRESYPFPTELLASRLPQDPAEASYHRAGELDFSKRQIDWNRPAAELHRWVRAMIFPPFQYPEATVNGRRLAVARVGGSLGEAAVAAPGVVVARSAGGIDVATADRRIRILAMVDPGDPGASAATVMARIGVGDQFA